MSGLNIHQRMAAITAELQTVAKNLNVDTGKGKGYKAVSERDVVDAVKPLEAKYGVYSYPVSRRIIESAALESENEWNGKVTKKTTFFERIETVYRFVNTDEPADYIETTTFAEGIDSQDKGSGKAMTYADKYALMKAYKISTGDDPDQDVSNDTDYAKSTAKAPKAAKKAENILEPDRSKDDHAPFCADCGGLIYPITKNGGERMSVNNVANYSITKFGRCLCADCMKKEQEKVNLAKLEAQAKAPCPRGRG